MKKMVIVVLAVLITLAFVSGSFARETAKIMKYPGEVVSVDSASNTAVVKGKQGDMTFDLSTTKWKGYKSTDEMKPGDKVTVMYITKDGKMMATSVNKSMTEQMKEKVKPDGK
jgi:hypothetical protein